MELIKMKQMGGIKCDNPNCTYRDDSVKPEEYPNYLNRPCPICGQNLLTEADFRSFCMILQTVNRINSLFNRMPNFIKKRAIQKSSDDDANMTINFNGSGKLDITIDQK